MYQHKTTTYINSKKCKLTKHNNGAIKNKNKCTKSKKMQTNNKYGSNKQQTQHTNKRNTKQTNNKHNGATKKTTHKS